METGKASGLWTHGWLGVWKWKGVHAHRIHEIFVYLPKVDFHGTKIR